MSNIKFISCDKTHRYVRKLGEEFLDIEFTEDFDKIEKSDKKFILWNPYGYLAHNKDIYHKKYSTYKKLKSENKEVYIVERGALPNTIFIDKSGFLCDSDAYSEDNWDQLLLDDEEEKVSKYINWLKYDEHTLEPQDNNRLTQKDFLKKYLINPLDWEQIVFVPLQVHNDTVIKLWSGWVKDHEGFLNQVVRLINDNPKTLFLIKNHPCQEAKVNFKHLNVRMVDDSHYKDCMEVCDKLVTINSGLGLQAMCWEKPVIICGKSFYSFEGVNYKVNNYEELNSKVKGSLEIDFGKAKRFIFYLIDKYYTICTIQKISKNASVPKLIKELRMPDEIIDQKKLKILYPFNEYGWAFEFEANNYSKYSNHEIVPFYYNPLRSNFKEKDYDRMIAEQPDIIVFPSAWHYFKLGENFFKKLKNQGIKVVVQYNSHYEPKYFCKEADFIMASSKKLYDILDKNYAYKYMIKQHHFVDTERFTYSGIKDFIIGWAGRFDNPVKRTHLLLQLGYPILIKSNYHNFLHENRSHDEMKEFYEKVDIVIITSTFEGSPMPLIEAMACGKVVLSTDVGVASEILPEGCVISGKDEEEIVKNFKSKLNELKNDRKKMEEIGLKNYNYIKNNLAWNKAYEGLDKIYNKVYIEDLKACNLKLIDTDKISGIFEQLNWEGIDFWLLKDTCLQAVRSCSLNNEVKDFYIGTDNLKIKEVLKKFHWKEIEPNVFIKKDIKLHVTLDSYRKTKEKQFAGMKVKVPLPVIGYLKSEFGSDWQNRKI